MHEASRQATLCVIPDFVASIYDALLHTSNACCCVAALLVAVATTTQVFWDVEPAAGKLLLPYLAWTAYATILNAWIWNKNPKVCFINSFLMCGIGN